MKLTKNGQVSRWCVVFYALISLAAALLACMYILLPFDEMRWYISRTFIDSRTPVIWVLLIIALALYCAWSVYLIVNALSRKPRIDKSSVSLQSGETGSVRVSISALDTLVKEAVSNVKGVGDIKTYIINHEDSITVKIEMELLSDEHIPNVTMLMQRDIKGFIEEYSGIAVREVSIMVLAIRIPEQPYREDRDNSRFYRAEYIPPRQDEAPVTEIEISPVVSVEEELPEAEADEPDIEEPQDTREPEFKDYAEYGSIGEPEPIEEAETEPETEAEFEN